MVFATADLADLRRLVTLTDNAEVCLGPTLWLALPGHRTCAVCAHSRALRCVPA